MGFRWFQVVSEGLRVISGDLRSLAMAVCGRFDGVNKRKRRLMQSGRYT